MRKTVTFVLHIVALALISVISIWAFIYFKEMQLMQLYVVITAILAYIAWGAIYHFLNKRLTLELLLEYLLVGALVLLLYSWTLFT